MVLRGFDLGVTHFDLANNYGHRRVLLKKLLAVFCEMTRCFTVTN